MISEPERGHVYRMKDPEYGTLHCLVVSTVTAGHEDRSCIAVRVAMTADRHLFPFWVRLSSGDPGCGYVDVTDLDRVDAGELVDDLGEVTDRTWHEVQQSLKRMLGL